MTETKFEPWSNKKILVKYEERNQYRVWLSEKKKIDWVIRARDVQFNEDSLIYNVEVAVSIFKVIQLHTVNAEQEDVQLFLLSSSQLSSLSLSLEYVSSYSFILILSNQLEEMKKEKEDVMNIFFTIDRSVLAESWCSKRERQLFIKLKLKAIMIYLTVFDVIVDVMKKKKDFKNESQTFKQTITSHKLKDWKKAMNSEYNLLMTNFTWTLKTLLSNQQALKNKWIYHYKRESNSSIL